MWESWDLFVCELLCSSAASRLILLWVIPTYNYDHRHVKEPQGLSLRPLTVRGPPTFVPRGTGIGPGESSLVGIEPGFSRNSSPQRELTCHLRYPLGLGGCNEEEKTNYNQAEGYEQRNRIAEGLGVEERRQLRRQVAVTKQVEECYAVVDDGVDVRYVSVQPPPPPGVAVALVVDGAYGKPLPASSSNTSGSASRKQKGAKFIQHHISI
nr:hypothetical protein Iba_chr12dCG6790 [Ipomoea batatas]